MIRPGQMPKRMIIQLGQSLGGSILIVLQDRQRVPAAPTLNRARVLLEPQSEWRSESTPQTRTSKQFELGTHAIVVANEGGLLRMNLLQISFDAFDAIMFSAAAASWTRRGAYQ